MILKENWLGRDWETGRVPFKRSLGDILGERTSKEKLREAESSEHSNGTDLIDREFFTKNLIYKYLRF